MKPYLVTIALFIYFGCLSCLEIPFSPVPVKTDANLFQTFVRVEPDDKKPETLKTKAWLWYDEENLYIRYEAQIDSTFKKGEFSPRDNASNSDFLRIQLITIPEAYYAYYYAFYPSGSLLDAIRKVDMSTDMQWNSAYSYTSEYSDTLFSIVAKLPFKDMRFKAKPPYRWKIILTRYNQEHEEFYSHPYANTLEYKNYFAMSEDITLTHQIKQNSDWKFRPYYAKGYDLIKKESTYDPEHVGMDISFSPSTKTKLKIALNPDFSDVPPDDAQNNYNSKYPPYYSENRFFFTEDLDAFAVDYEMFYTRFIVQPQIAAKLTGNSETWNYGYLFAKDKKITDDGYVINHDDIFQLASVIKTLPKFQMVLSGANRMNAGYYNHIGSLYWDWEFQNKWHFGTSHLFTVKHLDETDISEEENKLGDLSTIKFSYKPKNWDIDAKYLNFGKDLSVDTGRYYETGYESYRYNASYNSDTKEKYLKSWGANCGTHYSNFLNAKRSFDAANAYASIWFSFLPKYSVSYSGSRAGETYLDKEYDSLYHNFSFNWSKFTSLGFALNYGMGENLIYNLRKTSGNTCTTLNIWGSLGQKFNYYGNISHYRYEYERINYIYCPEYSPVIMDNNYLIGSLSLNYNFNNNMTLRNGLSISTYDADGYYSNVTFYTNYRYEFRKDWFLYLGYQTGQYQDEKSLNNDPLGHFIPYMKSAYLKISLTL